ncbi:peptidase S9 prolyl oligopeptidase active site domain-containing protein [Salinisphaera sp. S4-8]|uniref:S9 family peptidase n=1 Tax=Salinisphaera sp. S4-8 TaxID=633357 RepID=UPI003340E201
MTQSQPSGERDIRPYGSWPSAITADNVAAAGRKLSDVCIDRARATPGPYWIESRPEEAGRNTIMALEAQGAAVSLLDAPLSARSAVHEYGGAAFTVHDGTLWFVNAADQVIYRRAVDGTITPVSAPDDAARFADLQYDPHHARLFVVAETPRADAEPKATIETIAADGTRQVVAEGHDFYASPRLAPDGKRLVWLAWNHPDMPWDASELWQADIAADGCLGSPHRLWAPADASLFGPRFDRRGRLHIVCDENEWWNIYRERRDTTGFEALTHERAEFGVPQWVFGQSTYAFTDDGRLIALASAAGVWRIGEVDRDSGEFRPWPLAWDFYEQIQALGDDIVVVAANARTPKQLVAIDREAAARVVRATDGLPADAALAMPEPVSWPTADGDNAHGLYYAPTSHSCRAPANERPPLILKCHGGPTGATSTALDARIQYWTSRGYAVLDVNYRGSTGYGRSYRQKLTGAWGVADVADCGYGARYLAERGLVDGQRVLISGSSAGGYTVLCVLTFTDIAAAGASYYGIGDLRRLMASTHKFESRYLHRLIGADDALLTQRSPLAHAEQLRCPVLFLQGLKDKVVPPDQAETMAAALRDRGVPVAYVVFAEERHGFRDAANIRTAIESERAFYTRVLGIAGVGDCMQLAIDNFEAAPPAD